MHQLWHILTAALTGFASGLLISIPVGPVNLTIINQGAQRGFKHGFLVGLGASTMEIIYCSIAFTGIAGFFNDNLVIKSAIEVFSFLFMMFLGMKFLLIQSVPKAGKIEETIEQTLHPHSSYMTGFVRVMANPAVLLFWILLSLNFFSHGLVRRTFECKTACILGVALGTNLWFLGLSYAVARGQKKFSKQTLVRMERGSGVGLLILGIANAFNIIHQLARAHGHSG